MNKKIGVCCIQYAKLTLTPRAAGAAGARSSVREALSRVIRLPDPRPPPPPMYLRTHRARRGPPISAPLLPTAAGAARPSPVGRGAHLR